LTERATNAKGGWRAIAPAALIFSLAIGFGGCVDKETAFVDKPALDQPTDSAFMFVGYVRPDSAKLTACGNCHATFQSSWMTTGHAEAWETLQGSGHAQTFCEPCHTTNELGNPITVPAGFNAAAGDSTRYLDVQCESCHAGVGASGQSTTWEHVNDPLAVRPLASITADTAATTGCGECHTGEHHPFIEQWAQSGHANTSFASGRTGCDECHEGRTALVRKFFETSDYVEKFGDEVQPIVCAVCHDPHGSAFTANLRAPINLGSSDVFPSTSHLCYQCHSRIGTPPSTHGPHAAQGLLVLQTDIGWLPAGFDEPPVGGHGNPDVNNELCITCHVVMYEITDQATGEFQFQSVGHLFKALPCLDAEGIPTVEDTCTDAERDFTGCTACHDEQTARNFYDFIINQMNSLTDSLWFDTNGNNAVDPGVDAGLLPQVAALDTVQLDPRDGVITVGEGAFWNAQLAYTKDRPFWADAIVYPGIAGPDDDENGVPDGVEWSAHKASGDGVHNPKFLRELLRASIDAVLAEYFTP
jgi:predicted CXXCH cytochrome family protein